jgi:hypothetical protein
VFTKDFRRLIASVMYGVAAVRQVTGTFMSHTPKRVIDQRIREAAARALNEAEERRKLAVRAELPEERGGQAGPEPTRYGDWEKKGIVSDF